jgi:hypothetical protein
MDLAHAVSGNPFEEGSRIETVVGGAHVDVVHV